MNTIVGEKTILEGEYIDEKMVIRDSLLTSSQQGLDAVVSQFVVLYVVQVYVGNIVKLF